MNVQIKKEIRGVLPAATAAIVIPGALELMDHKHTAGSDGGLFFFAIFTAFTAASSFAHEMSEGTFPLLLAQPLCRNRLWSLKLTVLALTLTASFIPLVALTSLPARYLLWLGLPALCALGLTPWLTLRLRDGFSAVVATLAIEWVMMALDCQAFRWRPLLPEERLPSAPRYLAAVIAATFCCVVGLLAGYRALRTWRAAPVRGPRFSGLQFGLHLSLVAPPQSGWMSLVLKELGLQDFSVIWITSWSTLLLILLFGFTAGPGVIKGLLQFNTFVFPIMVGAASLSRERQSGILDAQLALPVPVTGQWVIKLVVCFSLVLIGTILIPGLLIFLQSWRSPMPVEIDAFHIIPLLSMGTCLAILGSSITRGMLRAGILCVATSIGFFIYADGFTRNIFAGPFGQHLLHNLVSTGLPRAVLIAFLVIVVMVTMYMVLRPTLDHFRHPHAARNVAGLFVRAVVMATIFLAAEESLLVLQAR